MLTHQKNWLLAVVIGFVAAMPAFGGEPEVPASIEGVPNVSAEKVVDLLQKQDDVVLIDSRKPSDHKKGYIEGSIALPNTDTNEQSLAKYIKTKSTPVIFYCNGDHCWRSHKAIMIAKQDGYSNIYWFRGGWGEWLDKGYPVTK